jgi:hypothetical protein
MPAAFAPNISTLANGVLENLPSNFEPYREREPEGEGHSSGAPAPSASRT